MFDEVYKDNKDSSYTRWGLSLVLAVVCYVALFYTISILRGTVVELPQEETRKVDVEFAEIQQKEEPKPAPEPPKVAAPVIPPDMKVVEVDKPLQETLVPTSVPDAAPKEADPSMDRGVKVYGKYVPGTGDPLGVEGGKTETPAKVAEPVRLPEDAVPPQPLKDNPLPKYPAEARNRGITGVVVLKIIVDTQGNVGKVEVLRGEEPFVGAAVEAVRKWKYKPAYYQNKPIMIYHIVKIPFSLA